MRTRGYAADSAWNCRWSCGRVEQIRESWTHGLETLFGVSRRSLNWALVVVPFVPAFAAGGLLASAAASGDHARIRTAVFVWGAVTLVSLAVVILGAWRIWLEYKRFGRLW
jgi:hypothetical protein